MHKTADRILKESLNHYIAQAKERNSQASLRSVAKHFEFPPLPTAKWIHILILSYLQTATLKKGDLQQQTKFLSERLKVPIEELEVLIDELESAGLLKSSPQGFEVGLLDGNFQEPGHVLIRRVNAEILSHALNTIKKLDDPEVFAKTDFSSITFAACSDKLPLLKEKIEKFQFEISELMDENSKNDCVYTLAVQLMEV